MIIYFLYFLYASHSAYARVASEKDLLSNDNLDINVIIGDHKDNHGYSAVDLDNDKTNIDINMNVFNDAIHLNISVDNNATDPTAEQAGNKENVNNDKNADVTNNITLNNDNEILSDLTRFLDTVDREPVDNATALILTPYIENNLLLEARELSAVNSSMFLGIHSYTGFLTVNKTYNSNLFFWYFPVEGKSINDTPTIIWLQGGPGSSSLFGLFNELGPFIVESNGELKKRVFSWGQNHSLLFIDNPVGTGFSFTDSPLGYARDMATYSEHLYVAVEQLLKLFPELRVAPLYIAGESYAGKYVPCLAMELHKHKTSSALDVNLQGIIVGNGDIDPALYTEMSQAFYNFGLIHEEDIDTLKLLQEHLVKAIAANNNKLAKWYWTKIIVMLLSLSWQNHAYNFLVDDIGVGNYAIHYIYKSDVKRAIHVGDLKHSFINTTVNMELTPDFLSSTSPLYESLLENYRVLVYCGQLDQMMPCAALSQVYRKWQWSGKSDFIKASTHPILYKGKRKGLHKTGGGLTEALIIGAGHMVPMDTPGVIQEYITSFTHRDMTPSSNKVD